ncbi:MAG TPA: TonB-dependent receptor plug domain-containing protein, partial [Solimonas sp.]
MTPSAPAVTPQTMPQPGSRPLFQALLLGLALGLAQPAAAEPASAAATAAPVSFDVPAGPLGDALSLFAAQAGVPFSFDAALVQGKTSPGLRGSHGIEQGFAALLAGSGLQVLPQGEGRYLLRPLPPPPSAGGPVQLPAVAVKAASIDPSITENTNSYTTKAVSVGGKTARDPRQVQQSVSVITAQRIRDQNLTNAEEMLGQATGVTLTQTGGYSSNASFNARGFSMGLQMDGGAPGLNYFWY